MVKIKDMRKPHDCTVCPLRIPSRYNEEGTCWVDDHQIHSADMYEAPDYCPIEEEED